MSGPKRGRDGRQMNPASLANLRPNPENLEPGAGAWQPGDAPHLEHGARSRRPQRSPEWSPAVERAVDDLEHRVGDELRDSAGELLPWARPSIEAVALQRVAAWRVERHVADLEARGRLKPADADLASKVAERYHRALEREALTLRSRLEASGQARTLAEQMADDADLERRERELARREAELDRRASRGADGVPAPTGHAEASPPPSPLPQARGERDA